MNGTICLSAVLLVMVADTLGSQGSKSLQCQLLLRTNRFLAQGAGCTRRSTDRPAKTYRNQPTCSVPDAVNKAVAKIDKMGTLVLSDGGSVDYHLKGVVSFYAINPYQTRIYAVFTGVKDFFQDSEYFSLHVHELGEINSDCSAPADHFNPCGKSHSDDPTSTNRHVGDVGRFSLTPGSDEIIIDTIDTQVKLSGALSVAGRSVTVHAGQSSARVGCATIGLTRWDGNDQRHPDTYHLAQPPREFWRD